MVQWDVPRSPTSALLMTQLAAEHGVDEATCLEGTRLRREQLATPGTEVNAKQELALIANLLDALGDPPGLGVEAGTRYHLTAYGIWGFALISSPTFRSAIDIGLRYVDLTFAFCRIEASRQVDRMQLVLDTPDIPAALRRFVIERDAAAIRTMQRDLFAAPIPIREVRFAFSPPADGLDRYVEVFGVVPDFDAGENVVGFDSALLDVPLPQANEHTAALAQAQCRDLLDRRLARGGLAGRVRDLLVGRIAHPPDADHVSAALHMSDRTLRHRLAAEGTSFRALLDEVRERLAEEMLLSGLTVAEIAERLGYVEVSSFSQAFRRWKGVGPRAYRATAGTRQRLAAGR